MLAGHPNLKRLNSLRIGQTIRETLDVDHAGEQDARTLCIEARHYCDDVGVFITRALIDCLGGQQYGLLNAKPAGKAGSSRSEPHNRGTAVRHMAPRSRESARHRLWRVRSRAIASSSNTLKTGPTVGPSVPDGPRPSAPLDDIPGIGATRKRALLQHFGSAKAVARAGLSDLQAVDGISEAMAKTIADYFSAKG